MRKFLCIILALTAFAAGRTDACTNVIISPGASADGSAIVSYAAARLMEKTESQSRNGVG